MPIGAIADAVARIYETRSKNKERKDRLREHRLPIEERVRRAQTRCPHFRFRLPPADDFTVADCIEPLFVTPFGTVLYHCSVCQVQVHAHVAERISKDWVERFISDTAAALRGNREAWDEFDRYRRKYVDGY